MNALKNAKKLTCLVFHPNDPKLLGFFGYYPELVEPVIYFWSEVE